MKICLKRVVVFIIILSMLAGAAPFEAIADSNTVAIVWEDGVKEENATKYTDFKTAWNAAREKGNIKMLKNCNISTALDLGKNQEVTFYMNGKKLDRNKANEDADISDSGGNGSVIRMGNNSKLTIIGGNTETTHEGYVSKNIWFSSSTVPSGKTELDLTGALITGGGTDSDYGGAITLDEKAELIVEDVTFAGNASDEYGASNGNGGALKLKATGAKLQMKNCRICYNRAVAYGGGIITEGDEVEIILENTKIDHNKARYGGGVYIDDEKTALIMDDKSVISNNVANDGGGVYIDEESATVRGGSITSNTARKGGGIYICDDFAAVIDCEITKNKASDKGGGMYLDVYGDSLNIGNDCTFQAIKVTENEAENEGGGLYIEDAWEDINLKNEVIIKNNTGKEQRSANMYFESGSDSEIVITGSGGRGSHICMGTENDPSSTWYFSTKGTHNEAYYYSDVDGYYIGYDLEKCKLGFKKGSAPEKAKIVEVKQEDFKAELTSFTYDLGEDSYPVYRGYYSRVQSGEGSYDDTYSFYYSDGYFFNDPEKYDPHLASLAMNLVNAGGSSKGGGKEDYTNKFTDIRQLLCNMGCDDSKTRINDEYMKKMSSNSIGVIISQKTLYEPDGTDSGRILVPVVVRSSGYETEWAGNFNLGTDGEHAGFKIAAETVISELNDYIFEQGLTDLEAEGKICFLIAGFSRGGATANLVSKVLTEMYYGTDNRVYGYTFAAPLGGVQKAQKLDDEDYYNIHNSLHPGDFVTYVAPIEMGFKRYGVDHYVPGSEAGKAEEREWYYEPGSFSNDVTTKDTKYYKDNVAYTAKRTENGTLTDESAGTYGKQRDIMLKQFPAVAGADGFSDYFHIGTIDMYTFFDILEETGDADVSVDEWIQDFLHYLQLWGTYHADDTRKYLSEKEQPYGQTVLEGVSELLITVMNTNLFSDAKNNFLGQDFLDWVHTIFFGLFTVPSIHSTLFNDLLGTTDATDIKLLIDEIWFTLDSDVILDGFSSKEKEEIKKCISTVLMLVLKFVERDHKTSEKEYEDGLVHDYNSEAEFTGTLSDWFIQTGTLVTNTSFLKNHTTQYYQAWIRSYDSYYTDYEIENYGGGSSYAPRYVSAQSVSVEPPSVSGIEVGGRYNQNVTVSFALPEKLEGGSIYYKVSYTEEGSEKVEEEALQLYTEPIEFTAKDNNALQYEVSYYTMYYGSATERKEVNFTIEPISFVGSIIGTGSIGIILLMTMSIISGGTIVYLYQKRKKTNDKGE